MTTSLDWYHFLRSQTQFTLLVRCCLKLYLFTFLHLNHVKGNCLILYMPGSKTRLEKFYRTPAHGQ
uniref:Uncharacterized protein n=1 Tax=Arundo donax TaxID=35708 RepID=A0A0A8YF77_ARUDO